MSLHTPGPWLCLDGKIISHTQTTGAPIARVYKRQSPHVTADNAHLIVASPTLLAALRRLSAAAAARDNIMGDPCALMAAQAELRDANIQACAAIAKATGVQP